MTTLPSSHSKHSLSAAIILVLAGISSALHIWKLPPALPVLQKELGFGLVEAGFLLSVIQIAGMSLGLLISLTAERIGLRRSVMTGLIIMGMGSIAGTLTQSVSGLMIFRAVEGCGFLITVLPIPTLIRQLVAPAHLSRVMGIWASYLPTGTIISLIAGSWVLSLRSWQFLWGFLGLLSFATVLIILYSVPSDTHRSHSLEKHKALHLVKTTLSAQKVWAIALIFCFYGGQWTAIIGFLPTIYSNAGVDGVVAGLLTGTLAGMNIVGNLFAGKLLHKNVSARRLIIIGLSTMIACAFAAFALNLPVAAQFIAIALFSGVGGLIPATLFVLAVSFAPTPQTTSTTVGWMQQCSSFGQFAGPPVVAWLVNLAGGWQWAWVATASFAVVGIILAISLGKQADRLS